MLFIRVCYEQKIHFWFALCILLVGLIAIPLPASATTQMITTTGEYTMGEGETMLVAKERAVTVAMRNAVEQAGVYLENFSQVKNMQLTKDEINVIAAGTIEVLDKKFS